MHKSFIISEEERKRILRIHENATKSQYLKIISEATTHPKSVEPYKPTDEEIEKDIKNDPEIYPKDVWKPCLAKMAKTKGWYKGVEGYTDVNGNEIGFDFWTPSKTSGRGMLLYHWNGGLYKQTGDTIEENYMVSRFNCNQRPFSSPAVSETELLQGKATLTMGDKSPLVVKLNNALVKAGKLSADKQNSDVFDNVTKQAVIAFQKENVDSDGKKLRPDGVVGKRTWGAMMTNDLTPIDGVSDVAIQKSAERVFGGELEKTMKTSPLFTQHFSKSNAEKIATVKGEIPSNNVDKGQSQEEKPKEQEPSTSATMKQF